MTKITTEHLARSACVYTASTRPISNTSRLPWLPVM
jgi:hypothetical protein